MSTPLVTVILPAYNSERYVADAIASVLGQSHSNLELLVADDGSSDNTRAVIDKFTDPRIRRCHNAENLGPGATRNILLRQARGEYVAWQDADDIAHPFRLERLLRAFREDPRLGWVGSNVVRRYERFGFYQRSSFPLTHEEIWRRISQKRQFAVCCASSMVRREALCRVGGFRQFFDRTGCEDLDLLLRIAENVRVGNVPEVLYETRYVSQSVSRRAAAGDYLRLYALEIVFFLFRQRQKYGGFDGLMPGGNRSEFELFLASLRARFEREPSLVWRRRSENARWNMDYRTALRAALLAVRREPLRAPNYWVLVKVFGSAAKTLMRSGLLLGRSVLAEAQLGSQGGWFDVLG